MINNKLKDRPFRSFLLKLLEKNNGIDRFLALSENNQFTRATVIQDPILLGDPQADTLLYQNTLVRNINYNPINISYIRKVGNLYELDPGNYSIQYDITINNILDKKDTLPPGGIYETDIKYFNIFTDQILTYNTVEDIRDIELNNITLDGDFRVSGNLADPNNNINQSITLNRSGNLSIDKKVYFYSFIYLVNTYYTDTNGILYNIGYENYNVSHTLTINKII